MVQRFADAADAVGEQDVGTEGVLDPRHVRREPSGVGEHRGGQVTERVDAPDRIAAEQAANLVWVSKLGHVCGVARVGV